MQSPPMETMTEEKREQKFKYPEEKPLRPEMAKLVAAVVEKRRKLGFTEWEMLPIEDVVDRIVEKPTNAESGDPTNVETGNKSPDLKPTLHELPPDDGSDMPPLL